MATIQGVYVALFGRPADPTGLAYFNSVTKNGADLSGIGDLASTQEYKDRFAGQNNIQIVSAIYKSLFNRDPEAAGLSFFVDALNKGTLNAKNIAIAILDGATGSDKTTVENKLKAADAYTKALDTGPEIVAYSGTTAAKAGIDFLAAVTTTVPDTAAVDAAVAKLVTNVTNTAGKFTLTEDADTATANVFEAPLKTLSGLAAAQTLTTSDTLTGTGTKATLNAVLNGAPGPVAPTLTGIENVNVTTTAAATLSLRNATGVKTISTSDNSGGGLTVQDIALASDTKLSVANTAQAATFSFSNASVAGTDDTVALTLSNVQGAVTLNAVSSGAIENVKLTSSGGTATTAVNSGGLTVAGLKTLTIDGDTALNLGTVAATTVTKVDASALKGNLSATFAAGNLEVTSGEGADTLSFSGVGKQTVTAGKGNDTVNLQGNLTSDDVLDGGEGRDTLVVNTANPAAGVSAKGFEVFQIGLSGATAAAAAAGTYDLSKLTGSTIDTVVVKNTTGNAITIDKLAGGSKIVLNGTDGNTANATDINNVTVQVTDATKATSLTDVLNVDIGRVSTTATDGTGSLTVNSLVATGVETININSAGSNSANIITTLTDANLQKLVITGDDALTITNTLTGSSLAEIDASAATGAISLSSSDGTGTGGLGVTIKGGAGDDVLTGGANNDTITGGAGNNTLNGGAGADNITGGAGNDTITGGTGIDSINISSGGTDTINLSGVVATANRDIVTGFEVGTAASADKVDLAAGQSTAGTIGAGTTIFEAQNAVLAADKTIGATTDVLEVNVDLSGGNLLSGAGLFTALGITDTNGTADAGEIELIASANAGQGYILAYGGGNAYLYHYNAGAGDTIIAASEVQLVGVFNNVAAGAFDASNII